MHFGPEQSLQLFNLGGILVGFQGLIGEQVSLLLSGHRLFNGILTDMGSDIVVLYNGEKYIYIPRLHVHSINRNKELEDHVRQPIDSSMVEDLDLISYRRTLIDAKSSFLEIDVTGNLTYHGYIMNVLDDYFVFYSPVFKQMLISLSHLKWLSPYQKNISPYNLGQENIPVKPANVSHLCSLENQLKREVGKLVIFDGGSNPLKIGILSNIDQNMIELLLANGNSIYLNLDHIKSTHFS